jgi:hypothetical protein
MALALWIGLQAATAAPALEAVDFDLARYHPGAAKACDGASGREIVVCGRRINREIDADGRLARLYGPRAPIKAEVGLGGNLVGPAYVEEKPMGQGSVSKRALVGVKLPF